MTLRNTFATVGTVGVLSLAVATQSASAGEQPSAMADVWAKASLATAYTLSEHLNPFSIDIEVTDGHAVLGGTVGSEVERDLAVEIARGIDGIDTIDDRLEIANDNAARTGQQRGFYEHYQDAVLAARVKSRLLWNTNTSGMRINVDAERGAVTLSGTVFSEVERDLAVQIARTTDGTASVEQRLAVQETEARGQAAGKLDGAGKLVAESAQGIADSLTKAANDAGQAGKDAATAAGQTLSDSLVTAKVKSYMAFSSNVDAIDIDVDTVDGVVTLQGTVDSDVERDLAIELTKNIVGVRAVNNGLKVESGS